MNSKEDKNKLKLQHAVNIFTKAINIILIFSDVTIPRPFNLHVHVHLTIVLNVFLMIYL